MFSLAFGGLLHVVSVVILVSCVIILKKSNDNKPEALISEMDLIFNDSVACNVILALIVSGYSFSSIFLVKIDPWLDVMVCLTIMTFAYLLLCTQGCQQTLSLLHIYQLSSFLENFTYQHILWIVRIISGATVLTSFAISIFVFGKYPYVPIVHQDLLDISNSTMGIEKLYVSENPVWYLLSFIDGALLLEILRQKWKFREERQNYIKAAVFAHCIIGYVCLGIYLLYR